MGTKVLTQTHGGVIGRPVMCRRLAPADDAPILTTLNKQENRMQRSLSKIASQSISSLSYHRHQMWQLIMTERIYSSSSGR